MLLLSALLRSSCCTSSLCFTLLPSFPFLPHISFSRLTFSPFFFIPLQSLLKALVCLSLVTASPVVRSFVRALDRYCIPSVETNPPFVELPPPSRLYDIHRLLSNAQNFPWLTSASPLPRSSPDLWAPIAGGDSDESPFTMRVRHLLASTALLCLAAGQVTTKCNPLERDNCPPDPAFGSDHVWYFNSTPEADLWETTAGVVDYTSDGAAFTIKQQGDSPTLRTKFYFFFGRTELWLKVAPGTGIISSMMWLSDDLDEVDWEFLGSNKSFATTNYFGKGSQDWHNGGAHPMTGMQDDFHNYTTTWTKDQLEWYIDGNLVRTLHAADANDTRNYPQSPMRMSIGIWAGGDPSLPEGTRKWAGGDTDYSAAPFTMWLQKAQVTDYSSGHQYVFGDRSGSWQSIKIEGGSSRAQDTLAKAPGKSTGDKWNDLPGGAKAAVYSGVGVVAAIAFAALLFYFVRQRRRGALEAQRAEERANAERLEMERFEGKGMDPAALTGEAHGHGAEEMRVARPSDAESYHVPETTTSSPLARGSWGIAAAAGGGFSPNVGPGSGRASPAMSQHEGSNGRPQGPTSGLGLTRAQSPLSRNGTPIYHSQSPGMPPSGPLPSPRDGSRS
ncbi:hypothetical protein XA68_12796 [Ophiocordyceps unilateralis]|uniref:chitinase n=1 Tax=Ophiocordyceps unilateralis TaxID=268505 RepID=A0A2A9PC55_OPHUN|nr:hypothetical protein XA68_12796 [Ophiocordyceps unilateralis]